MLAVISHLTEATAISKPTGPPPRTARRMFEIESLQLDVCMSANPDEFEALTCVVFDIMANVGSFTKIYNLIQSSLGYP